MRRVFFSFHYNNDNWRTSQVRQIGTLEGQPLFSDNKWEEVKRKGDAAIKRWINENMENRSCIIVLIGSETDSRKYVNYEIRHAWEKGMGVVGIYVHNLKDAAGKIDFKGKNPFEKFYIDKKRNSITERVNPVSENEANLSDICKVYCPIGSNSKEVYANIKDNLSTLIEEAILTRNQYPK